MPVSVHGPNGVDHSCALMKEGGVAELGVEVPIVEEVVLVTLVALDALEPALHGVHGLQHGAQVVVHGQVAAQSAARAHHCLILQWRESGAAEALRYPHGVEYADSDRLYLVSTLILIIAKATKLNIIKVRTLQFSANT